LANCRYNRRVATLAASNKQAQEAAMQINTRTKLLMTAAAIMTAPVVAAATPAFASGGGGGGAGVSASGACTNGGHFKLKAKHDDGRIKLEYEVDSNRAGQVWAVRIKDNGVVVVSRHATTAGPSGSFTIEKKIANRAGSDKIHARATFKNHTCKGAVTL
jgi:hypothetical protein